MSAANERCVNTIHSNYVTDHRCQKERGHAGDCHFGSPFYRKKLSPEGEAEIERQLAERDAIPNSAEARIEDVLRVRMACGVAAQAVPDALNAFERILATREVEPNPLDVTPNSVADEAGDCPDS